MMRATMEVALSKLLTRYFLAIGMEFSGFDEEGNPIVIDNGAEKGICLHGESKEGYINVSEHPDLQVQVQVIEKLFDRVYGKSRQTTVLEGGVNPIQIKPVRSVDRARQIASIIQRTGAVPHEGRRRIESVDEDVIDLPESPEGGASVVPLRAPSEEEE